MITIGRASKLLGVTPKTIRIWEKEGKISSIKTTGGHRRYDENILLNKNSNNKLITIGYARVSSNDQKSDLERQSKLLELYCCNKGYEFEIISDLGSGLNYKKKGLVRLIKLICNSQIDRLIVTNKDRLLRFGSELVFSLCEHFGVEVIIINKTENSSFEEDLTKDVLELITVFSARLYGSRSHKNKQIIEELKEVANKL